MMKLSRQINSAVAVLLAVVATLIPQALFASPTDGTIDATYKYAWSQNIGWINFGTTGGNVHVTSTGLTGYAWSDNYGWINLSPAQSGVTNTANGNLSGSAWGEGVGYIDFNNVSIDSDGVFHGTATGPVTGTINFEPAGSIRVVTDWRHTDTSGGGTSPTITPGGSGGSGSQLFPPNPLGVVLDAYRSLIFTAQNGLLDLVAVLTGRSASSTPGVLNEIPAPGVPIITVYSGIWQLLATTGTNELVFAPLPSSVKLLTQQLPKLGETFGKVGIARFVDLPQLSGQQLTLPGLAELVGASSSVPVTKLAANFKSKLPPEIIFARAGHELIDLKTVLTLSETGEPEQRVGTIVGRPLTLVVRPDAPAKSVTGYVVFRSRSLAMMSGRLSPFNLTAALGLVAEPKQEVTDVPVEKKMVLQEFAYTDPDNDGVYTATITAPVVDGEYEVVSVINYVDVKLGQKILRLVTVVDPEGYVYEQVGGREIRIPDAVVSLKWLNPATSKYELWPAGEYQQTNPQTTGKSGSYSFLVPPGMYSVQIKAPGYEEYNGEPFNVAEGRGVHTNIELKLARHWPAWLDWQSILLVIVVVLLIYHLFRDRLRDNKH